MTERVNEGTTHYHGCWRVHHECALEYIAALEKRYAKDQASVRRGMAALFAAQLLDENFVHMKWLRGELKVSKDTLEKMARERIADLTAERDALKQENGHLCDDRYLGKCLEDMQPRDFATATDDELKEALEYCEDCRCHICQWTRYELERRQALARLSAPVSDEEHANYSGSVDGYTGLYDRWDINALIASRAKQPESEGA